MLLYSMTESSSNKTIKSVSNGSDAQIALILSWLSSSVAVLTISSEQGETRERKKRVGEGGNGYNPNFSFRRLKKIPQKKNSLEFIQEKREGMGGEIRIEMRRNRVIFKCLIKRGRKRWKWEKSFYLLLSWTS